MAESLVDQLKALAEAAPERRAEAFEKARAAATHPDREVRTAAAEAIAGTGEPAEAIEWLQRLAADEDVGVRYAAVAAAAGLPWKGRFGILRRALEDDDLGIVALAADGLSFAGDHRVASHLHEMIPEKRLQFGALEGLYALRDRDAQPVARRLFDAMLTPLFERTMAALILARAGDEDVRQFLRKRLRKRYSVERGLIVKHLLEVDPIEGRTIVESIAGQPRDEQRETALLTLTRAEPEKWWDATAKTIDDAIAADDLEVAAEVLASLADIDSARALPIARQHTTRPAPLGGSARRVVVAAFLRASFPNEVQLRCD